MILKSVIRYPECGFEKEETMPINSCQFFYECTNCKAILKPRKVTVDILFLWECKMSTETKK